MPGLVRSTVAHVAGWEAYNLHDLGHVSCGLDLYYADPAQPLTAAGGELDYLDHDLSDLSEVCKLEHRHAKYDVV